MGLELFPPFEARRACLFCSYCTGCEPESTVPPDLPNEAHRPRWEVRFNFPREHGSFKGDWRNGSTPNR